MAIDKGVKSRIGLLAALSASLAVGMTEWRGGHPIGSFAESFVAAGLMISSFIASAFVGGKVHDRIERVRPSSKLSGIGAWSAGILCFFAFVALVLFVPGVSEALDRLPESSE